MTAGLQQQGEKTDAKQPGSPFSRPAIAPDSGPLLRLHRSGLLNDQAMVIAWDIEQAYRSLSRRGENAKPRARMATARYCLWLDRLSRIGVPAGPVLCLVLDYRNLSEIDKAWRRRKGWARDMVLTALAHYPDVFSPPAEDLAADGSAAEDGMAKIVHFRPKSLSHKTSFPFEGDA